MTVEQWRSTESEEELCSFSVKLWALGHRVSLETDREKDLTWRLNRELSYDLKRINKYPPKKIMLN